jgi:4Fe-4S ferredoxin
MTTSQHDTTSCDDAPGRLRPTIDHHRCEGKADCAEVCPYGVFEVRPLAPEERAALPWLVRIKVAVHGGKQGFVVKPEACQACGLCVKACPEKAIKLGR